MQLLVPSVDQIGATRRDDLVRPGVGPRTPIPGPSQLRTRFLTATFGSPLGLVAVDVARDLRRAVAEATDVRRELVDLSVVAQRVTAGGECRAELRVAHDSGVADAVEGLDGVDDADGVEAPPRATREDAGVDLEVEVSVRVAGAGGVVPDERGLDLFDRHLDLSAAWSDTRRRVLRDPADDLAGRARLRVLVGVGDVGVERGGERPGLGSVDDDLDEAEGVVVVAQSTLRVAGGDVVPGDPAFVARTVEVGTSFAVHAIGADGDGVVLGDAAAFGEVVVVGARVVGLDVGARGGCGPAVELHSTVHAVAVTARHVSSKTPEMTLVRPRGTDLLRTFVACVPPGWETSIA